MELTIEVTDFCYNKCVHCSSNSSNECTTILDIEVIEDVVERLDPDRVILSGGEPVTYPLLFELCQFLHDREIPIVLNTCGVFKVNTDFRFMEFVDETYVSLLSGKGFELGGFKNRLPISYLKEHDDIRLEGWEKIREEWRSGVTYDPEYGDWLREPLSVALDLKRMGKKVYFNTPVFSREQVFSLLYTVYKMEVPIHLIKLIPHGRAVNYHVLQTEKQRKIAEEMLDQLDPSRLDERVPIFLIEDGYDEQNFFTIKNECKKKLENVHPKCKISHSLKEGRCRSKIKRTLLSEGKLIGCVAGKGLDEAFDVFKVCNSMD